ncbi:MAG: hypothetical protein KatS3mg103_1016 [Phycisphaerales bacterium]|nr:MAG: hypothetical protein KatS3mg103_1016 [Phycisphaerales bacterium]
MLDALDGLKRRLHRVGFWTLVSLMALTLASEAWLVVSMRQGQSDARLLNEAGRQRMLSQRVAWQCTQAHAAAQAGDVERASVYMERALRTSRVLVQGHHALRARAGVDGLAGQNPPEVEALLARAEPLVQGMAQDTGALARALGADGVHPAEPDRASAVDPLELVERVSVHAEAYLPIMDEAVDLYEAHARRHREALGALALVAGLAQLATLAVVAALGVMPAMRSLGRSIEDTGRLVGRLREAQRRSADLAEFARRSTNAMIRTDAARRILWVNEGFTRITGYRLEEVVGKTPGSVLQFEGTDPRTVASMREALDAGRPFRGRILNRGKDGREYWLDLEIMPQHDEAGRLVGFLAVESDVTELVRAIEQAEALAVERRRLAAGIEHSPEPIVVADLDGNVRFANAAAHALDARFGHRPHPGGPTLLRVPGVTKEPGLCDRMLEVVRLDRVFSERVEVRLCRDVHLPIAGRPATPREQTMWLHVTAAPLLDENGAIESVLIVKRDVTERVAEERQARLRAEGAEARARIGEVLAGEAPLAERLEQAVAVVLEMEQLNVQKKGGVFLLEPGSDRLRMAVHVGSFSHEFLRDEAEVPLGSCLCGRAALGGRIIVSDNCFEDERHERRWPAMTAHGHYIVPLMAEGQCQGVLFLYTDVNPTLDAGRMETLEIIGQMLAGAILRDRHVREVERATQEIREITAALDASNDCVFMFEADTLRFVYTNRGASEQVGYSAQELRSMTPLDIKPLYDASSFEALIAPLREDPGRSIVFRTEHRHRDGHRIPVEVSLQFMPGVGRAGRFLAIVRDITEQLATERSLVEAKARAESASQAKSEFLANMSHEIRTPMTAILGYLDLLAEGVLESRHDPTAREYIETIRRNGEHLLAIINDVLDVSKIEAGQMVIERIDVGVVRIIEDVASLMRPRAIERGVDLRVRYDGPMPERIRSDPTRLRQVLLNLVGNAIKFTEQGSVTIRVACDARAQRLKIAVQDTGIGMTPEQLRKVRRLDAFSQADTSMTRRFGGTGLGLRICNALLVLMGGGLAIESQPGKGTTVTATVDTGPLDGVAMQEVESLQAGPALDGDQQAAAADGQAPRPLEGRHVVLAEDGPDNQRLLRLHLERSGARVTICENGRLAVQAVCQALADQRPDLVLMDMQMPEMDGYEATGRIRKSGIDLPIVALTAHAMAGDRERCLQAGCDAYLTKPITRQRLIEACVRILAGKGVPDAPDAATHRGP